jgi:hypothetical protein
LLAIIFLRGVGVVGVKGKGLRKAGPESVQDEEDTKDLEDQNHGSLPEGKVMSKEEL